MKSPSSETHQFTAQDEQKKINGNDSGVILIDKEVVMTKDTYDVSIKEVTVSISNPICKNN